MSENFRPKVLENSTQGFNPVSGRPGLRLSPDAAFAGKPFFLGMSLPALFLFLVLALGLLSLSPPQGTVGIVISDGLSGQKARHFLSFLLPLPVGKFSTHRKSDRETISLLLILRSIGSSQRFKSSFERKVVGQGETTK
jgi:hypothetical protein